MGRLFWKFFLAFWLALLMVGIGVGLFMRWQADAARERLEQAGLGIRGQQLLNVAAATLEYGGIEALRALLAERRRPGMTQLYLLDEAGREMFGRDLDAGEVARARALAAAGDEASPVRRVVAGDGRAYLLFARADARPGRGRPPRPQPLPAWVPVGLGLFASLAFSALLAWYLTRPLRHLRQALSALSEGRMQTRVGGLMGRRRDEIADLGHDFDRMAQRLQRLVAAQRRLLHDVSHELRSPLARMQAAIGLARQDPRKQEAMLDRVEREAERLDELVGGLLTLSRLEAGADDAPKVAVDLVDLAAGVAADARFEARAAGREVRFTATTEATVSGWPELLQRAIENVIRNAVKFTADGSTVEVTVSSGASGRVQVAVADRGPGVREEALTAMFEPFRRVGEGDAPGFGLGLAIARRAVEAHGGGIVARNRPDGGLLMEIVLPLAGALR